jgi:transcriptional regulator with XRE-family HTH domain
MSLGSYLRSLREVRRLTLRAVEKKAGVSNAYLSQLETDKIRKPSPACLYKLSKWYKVPYEDLMRRAGYPVPETSEIDSSEQQIASVGSGRRFHSSPTLASFDDLTREEEETLLEYLAFLRSRKNKK